MSSSSERQLAQVLGNNFWYSRLGETGSSGRKYQVSPLFTRAKHINNTKSQFNQYQATIIASIPHEYDLNPENI